MQKRYGHDMRDGQNIQGRLWKIKVDLLLPMRLSSGFFKILIISLFVIKYTLFSFWYPPRQSGTK